MLFQSLQTLTKELDDPAVIEGLRKLGFEVAEIVKGGAGLLQWAIKNAAALSSLAHAAVTLGAALAAMGVAKAAIVLGTWTAALVASSVAAVRSAAAIQTETVALAANTAAQTANAGARGAGAGAGALRTGVNAMSAGVAGMGIGIGAAIYAYRVQKAHEETAAAEANGELLDALMKQRSIVEEQVLQATTLEAKAKAHAAIETQIVEIKKRQHLLDEEGQEIAGRAVFNLEFMRSRFNRLAGSKPAATSPGAANEILAQREGRRKELRGVATDLLSSQGAPVAEGVGMADLLAAVEKSSFKDEGKKILVEMLKELAAVEKEITAASEERGKGVEKQMALEAERFLKRQETMASLEEELGIQQQLTQGNELEAKLLEIQRDLRKEQAKIAASELAPADRERAAALAVQTAELQKQKVAADQLKEVTEAKQKAGDYATDAEAGFDKDLKGSKGRRAREKDKAKFLREFDLGAGKELREANVDEGAIAAMRNDAEKAYDQKARERMGRFGGTAKRSERDGMVNLAAGSGHVGETMLDNAGAGLRKGTGLTAAEEWRKKFTPLGDQIPTRPANAPELIGPPAPADLAKGKAKEAGKESDAGDKAGKEIGAETAKVSKALDTFKTKVVEGLKTITKGIESAQEAVVRAIEDVADEVDELHSRVDEIQNNA